MDGAGTEMKRELEQEGMGLEMNIDGSGTRTRKKAERDRDVDGNEDVAVNGNVKQRDGDGDGDTLGDMRGITSTSRHRCYPASTRAAAVHSAKRKCISDERDYRITDCNTSVNITLSGLH